ncbi:MAG: RNA polymerase sigma factor RpoH [Alphaproteobacteria bacterium GM7ARS4]|nr:RNA polymerase sigma factor RpoH [Alphaproteobacteria bacterium GM7ARS4]
MSFLSLTNYDLESGLSSYIRAVHKVPTLSKEEEYGLSRRWQEDRNVDAAHALVVPHLRLVVGVASQYRNYGLPYADLIAEGNIGLMRAVKRFDPGLGFRLSTYAIWWIRASITEYVLNSWSLVRTGSASARKKLFFGLKRVKNKLRILDNHELTDKQAQLISQELDVPEEDVIDMNRRLSYGDMSLNTPINFEEETSHHIDVLQDETPNQEVCLMEEDERLKRQGMLRQALSTLEGREQDIITARYLTEPTATLHELAQRHHISRERVRQIEIAAMKKIKRRIFDAERKKRAH